MICLNYVDNTVDFRAAKIFNHLNYELKDLPIKCFTIELKKCFVLPEFHRKDKF